MEQIFNPYLPLTEHIPDGEPHVFGDRVYIFGSHDTAHGTVYCEDHYTVWSAPVGNLRDWRCDGVSYRRDQDPSNPDDTMQLWAPDVAQGPDGRYYLYYCFPFYPQIGVAVSEKPEGPYEFYGHVHYPPTIRGGADLKEDMPFDPAILVDDDKRVFLYFGFAPAEEKEMILPEMTEEEIEKLSPQDRVRMEKMKDIRFGENAMVVELESDMLTAKEKPRVLIPGGHHSDGTGFEGHAFFEASSIRKLNGTYYFVYSSHKSMELCYAVSDQPDRGFRYGGTIISNGDIGYQGRKKPVYPMSNNHGGLVQIGDDVYIFYHRATNGTEFSRQGHAEKVQIAPDKSIAQVEMTSFGLNGEPLRAAGSYPAAIACHLTDPTTMDHIDYGDPVMASQIRITEQQNTVYITGVRDGAVVGYKYFSFEKEHSLSVELRGDFEGTLTVSHDEEGQDQIGSLCISPSADWDSYLIPIIAKQGKQALYFRFSGKGALDFKSFAFVRKG